MRLISATIRNYRIHGDVTVDFAPHRNLIGGPNECGKSTLVEAIHRGLFLRAKTGGEAQKHMASRRLGAGPPEVQVTFAVGEETWTVYKCFNGPKGVTRLQGPSGIDSRDADAEERLHQLLMVEEVSGGRKVEDRLRQQWGHLWVWQGMSSEDPCAHTEAEQPRLIQKLQEAGGAAAMLSSGDAAIADHFAETRKSIFQSSGKAKKGSAVERAEAELEAAEDSRATAAARLADRERAISDFEAAAAAIQTGEQNKATLELDRRQNAKQLAEVQRLREREKQQKLTAERAAEKASQHARIEKQVTSMKDDESRLQESLKPREEERKNLAEEEAGKRKAFEELSRKVENGRNESRIARRRLELVRSATHHLEKQQHLQEADEQGKRIQAASERRRKLERQLSELPEITEANLKSLRKQESERLQATSALEAMAAGIVVQSAVHTVRANGEELTPEQEYTVTESTEITTEGLRLLIRPGGGESLVEARQRRDIAEQALEDSLRTLSAKSIEDAANVVARRSLLEQDLSEVKQSLKHLDADAFEAQHRDRQNDAEKARAEFERRRANDPDFPIPDSLVEAQSRLADLTAQLQELESNESALEAQLKQAESRLLEVRKRLESQQGAIASDKKALEDIGAKLQFIVEQHGTDEVRRQSLGQARNAEQEASSAWEATRDALERLDPENCESDKERLDRAWENCQKDLQDARTKKAIAENELRSEGGRDPHATLAEAETWIEQARQRVQHARRHAQAIALLDDLFAQQQRSLSERFTKPLADKISEYLRCIFGQSARAEISLEDNAFQSIRILRDSQGLDFFDDLSSGAREQVAAAVRLATAEILAADHRGCLPLVFDDAFANADPERVRSLQRMLDHAATRGLQLIILSCNPSDYATLGADTIFLSPPPPALPRIHSQTTSHSHEPSTPTYTTPGETLSTTASTQTADSSTRALPAEPNGQTGGAPGTAGGFTSVMASPVDEEDKRRFLDALHSSGGKSGNVTLRSQLGWDEASYNAVKDTLVNAKQVIPGRGRGGSVRLPEVN